MHHILVSSWEYVDRLPRNTAMLPHHTRNKQCPRRGLQLRIDWRIHWRKVVEFSNCLTLMVSTFLFKPKEKRDKEKSRVFNMLLFPSLSFCSTKAKTLKCLSVSSIGSDMVEFGLGQGHWHTEGGEKAEGRGASSRTSRVWWFLSSSVTRWARESCLQISNRTDLSLLPGGGLAVKLTSQTPSLWAENR